MTGLVLCVVAVLAAVAGAVADSPGYDPGYDPAPIYRHKSSLQSRRRPFQSTLQPLSPYDDPLSDFPPRPYDDYPLRPYEDIGQYRDGPYRPSPYEDSPYGDLIKKLFRNYPQLLHGDNYPAQPYRGYPSVPSGPYRAPYPSSHAPYVNEPHPLSRAGKYLDPPHTNAVSPPVYPTKYPQNPIKNYPTPPSYPKPNTTTTARPYSFSYGLVDVRGNDFGAAEESDGREVRGEYSVLLPDGRLQTVSYSVEGDSGFVADVTYEGEAKFLDENGEEEGRASVKIGRGPEGGYPQRHRV